MAAISSIKTDVFEENLRSLSYLNDLGVKSYIFGYDESIFLFCET